MLEEASSSSSIRGRYRPLRPVELRSQRAAGGADVRRRRRLARDRRRGRRPPARRGRRHAHAGVVGASAPLRVSTRSTTSGCSPRRPTRSARSSSSPGEPASCAGAAPTSRRTGSTTCSRPGPTRCSSSTTSRRTRSTRSRSSSSSRAPPTCAARPAARSWAARRPSCPGIYREDELDFCGTVVGVVRRDDLIDGSRVEPGDVVVGLRVGGHPRERLLARPAHRRRRPVRRGPAAPADASATSTTCARSARAPTSARLRTSRAAGSRGTSSRVLPGASAPSSTPSSWERPAVFGWLAEHGVPEDELRRVFNLGIGLLRRRPGGGRRHRTTS